MGFPERVSAAFHDFRWDATATVEIQSESIQCEKRNGRATAIPHQDADLLLDKYIESEDDKNEKVLESSIYRPYTSNPGQKEWYSLKTERKVSPKQIAPIEKVNLIYRFADPNSKTDETIWKQNRKLYYQIVKCLNLMRKLPIEYLILRRSRCEISGAQ